MGSKGGGGGGGGGNNGISTIPAGSRKMVQSLKEIVSCSDLEIYAALKECNMDPNEAVNRLLSLGHLFFAGACLCVVALLLPFISRGKA